MNGLNILLVSFLISALTVPLFTEMAVRLGVIDIPDERKIHSGHTPRLGGLGIITGVFISVLIFWRPDSQYLYLALANLVIIGIGVYDDSRGASAPLKLFFQVLAATIIIFPMGVRFSFSVSWLSWLDSEIAMVLLTYFWIALVTNAVNLIDGVDGLAGGISFMAFGSLMVASYAEGSMNFFLCLAFLGGILGFLRYNLPKASVFMGDTGSLFLGFNIAVISLSSSFKTNTIMSVLMPTLFILIPLFDTFLAIVRRLLRFQNPMRADREHLHHKLLDLNLSMGQTLMVFYSLSIVLSGVALIYFRDQKLYMVLLAVFILYLFLIIIKLLNFADIGKFIAELNGNVRQEKNHKSIVTMQGSHAGLRMSYGILFISTVLSAMLVVRSGMYFHLGVFPVVLFAVLALVLLFYKVSSVSERFYSSLAVYWLFFVAAYYAVAQSLLLMAICGTVFCLLMLPRFCRISRAFVPFDLLNFFMVIAVGVLSGKSLANYVVIVVISLLFYIPFKTAFIYVLAHKEPEDVKEIL
jgi:UDP-GlcNAc:undecaprenyl-phosphate GlcNAc-1-phosphate transferase